MKAIKNMADELLKVPPHSIEAEQAVLGGLMLVPEALDLVLDRVNEGDFYRRDHRLIWRAITELSNKSMPCDAVTLGDWFEQNGMGEMIGGAAYLIELANCTPSAANIAAYADIVREKSIFRQLIDASSTIATDSFNPQGRTSAEVLEDAESRVFQIAEAGSRGRQGFISMSAGMKKAFTYIVDRHENGDKLKGVPTGFKDLDDTLCGLQAPDLIIVAARPSMGKTAFALQLAEATALKGGKAALVFSMEMSAEQLSIRQVSSLGRVDSQRMRMGKLEEEDWPRISNAISQLQGAHIYIDETGALSPADLRSRARTKIRELSRQGVSLGLIVVDYLQLMKVPGNRENRATEISEISRSLKALAKELNVPVVALSQLNRELEKRSDKRPMMSDLRESGAIEQDADVIMFLYRDEYYNKDSPDKGVVEVIIGKQRTGPTTTVKLTFQGQFTRFENHSPDSFVGDF